ncbi:hypothetical protein SNL152K_2615 [Streptomyces sp. NL15-2K]|nr:hypothetical protein SNL152K_2615 [Streptomyces sp. NL15-2K]
MPTLPRRRHQPALRVKEGHGRRQQIMAMFAAADAPLRARQVCEAMDPRA